VYPAEVWIGPDGLPHGVVVRFRQSLSSDTKADLVVYLSIDRFGVPLSIPTPTRTQVATMKTLGQLVHTAVGA
jgi:hypothetical protein